MKLTYNDIIYDFNGSSIIVSFDATGDDICDLSCVTDNNGCDTTLNYECYSEANWLGFTKDYGKISIYASPNYEIESRAAKLIITNKFDSSETLTLICEQEGYNYSVVINSKKEITTNEFYESGNDIIDVDVEVTGGCCEFLIKSIVKKYGNTESDVYAYDHAFNYEIIEGKKNENSKKYTLRIYNFSRVSLEDNTSYTFYLCHRNCRSVYAQFTISYNSYTRSKTYNSITFDYLGGSDCSIIDDITAYDDFNIDGDFISVEYDAPYTIISVEGNDTDSDLTGIITFNGTNISVEQSKYSGTTYSSPTNSSSDTNEITTTYEYVIVDTYKNSETGEEVEDSPNINDGIAEIYVYPLKNKYENGEFKESESDNSQILVKPSTSWCKVSKTLSNGKYTVTVKADYEPSTATCLLEITNANNDTSKLIYTIVSKEGNIISVSKI